ncbi:MAG: FAD:protein FMN transferase [Planctomycetes bacterium]|nr:FAD:protein FMN transferase [Planctomycetota bacterium]
METRRTIAGWLGAAALGLLGAACAAPQRFEFSDAAMGTTFRIVLYADDAPAAERAALAAFARVRELDARLSDYRDDSEISRLSGTSGGGEFVALSSDAWRVLALAQYFAQVSDGAFDATVGPAVALWRRARRQGELPSEARIADALERTGWRHVELDASTRSARLDRALMKLDCGGIAKGYALDAALDVLAQQGIERALVDGGGDVAARKAPPGSAGWIVAVRPFGNENTAVSIVLENAALATSGDAYQSLELDGVRYSHIVDPRTARALVARTNATVLAADGASADALATALCVLGPREGLELAAREGCDARIAREGPYGIESSATKGFEARILSASNAPANRVPKRPQR